jgi:hypothetical protein
MKFRKKAVSRDKFPIQWQYILRSRRFVDALKEGLFHLQGVEVVEDSSLD